MYLKKILCAFLAFCLMLSVTALTSCEEKSSSKPSSSADILDEILKDTDGLSSTDVLNEILTKEQQDELESTIKGIDFVTFPLRSDIEYSGNVKNIDLLSDIGIRGLPILVTESIKEEEAGKDSEPSESTAIGYERARFQAFVVCAVCRVKFYDLPVSKDAMFPSKHYYVRWSRAKEELPKIFKSDTDTDEKIKQYREFGILAIPYVNKEIENGNAEMEKFYPLIGAHLSTSEYLKFTEISDKNINIHTPAEIDKLLLDGAKDFDYKVWYEENEEDLNNLFKFLDAYCAEYEAENK